MRSEIAKLLDGTEENLKRIEALKNEFPLPLLNEWRYATRHAINLMEGDGGEEEREKAERHLARAYFDSCDMLLDCLLDRVRVYQDRYQAYPSLLAEHVKDYHEIRETVLKVHDLHAQAQGFTDGQKRERYAKLAEMIEPMQKAVRAFDIAAEDLAAGCRLQKRRDRREIIGVLGTLACVILAIAALLK